MSVILSEEQLIQKCCEWQGRLGLRDWDVRVSVVRQAAIDADSQGECSWQFKKRLAIIKILDPIDYPPDTPWSQDMELTLVHELLHVHFAPFNEEAESPAGIAQEQAIHAVSKALIDLHRRRATGE